MKKVTRQQEEIILDFLDSSLDFKETLINFKDSNGNKLGWKSFNLHFVFDFDGTLFSEKFFDDLINRNYAIDNMWRLISLNQKLSEKFIKKHFKLLDIDSLLLNKNISNKTKDKIILLKEII